MSQPKTLITGANGQLGRVLADELRKKFGTNHILASDINNPDFDNSPYLFLDVMNIHRIIEIIKDFNVNKIYHLAAILSANGEWNPDKTWSVNFDGFHNLLKICSEHNIELFFPSTIAVFGKTTPQLNTPQDSALLPETVYGISKATGELWCNYFHKRYDLDVRSVRYPGIIGYQSIPSGGTTDYAVEIFHAALKGEKYECFLEKDTRLPMMYIFDAIRATIELMEAPKEKVKTRIGYNLSAFSFTPEEIYQSILRHYPDFKIEYKPDFRQKIAESWSESIDDSRAREEWNWKPQYSLDSMVDDMIKNLKEQYV